LDPTGLDGWWEAEFYNTFWNNNINSVKIGSRIRVNFYEHHLSVGGKWGYPAGFEGTTIHDRFSSYRMYED
jgi:hypothetical protein